MLCISSPTKMTPIYGNLCLFI